MPRHALIWVKSPEDFLIDLIVLEIAGFKFDLRVLNLGKMFEMVIFSCILAENNVGRFKYFQFFKIFFFFFNPRWTFFRLMTNIFYIFNQHISNLRSIFLKFFLKSITFSKWTNMSQMEIYCILLRQ